jgi:hypothetical protein
LGVFLEHGIESFDSVRKGIGMQKGDSDFIRLVRGGVAGSFESHVAEVREGLRVTALVVGEGGGEEEEGSEDSEREGAHWLGWIPAYAGMTV